MAYHNNITQAAQKAVQAYIRGVGLSYLDDAQVYTSILDDNAANPSVLCRCKRAQGRVTTEGNWVAHVRVELRENADDVEAEDHFDRAGELFALFRTDTLATDLSAALADWTAFQIVVNEQGWDSDGRLWVSYLDMEIECCGTTIV